jgi:hypothetical protein
MFIKIAPLSRGAQALDFFMLKLASDSVAEITSAPLEGMDKFFSLYHGPRKLLFDALD